MTLELEALVAYIDIVLGVGKLWIKREGKELRKRTNKNYVMKKMINQLKNKVETKIIKGGNVF